MKNITLLFLALILNGCFFSSIDTGERGAKVTFGEVSRHMYTEGLYLKAPWTEMVTVDTKQQSQSIDADCFSSDLQYLDVSLKIVYHIPETSVLTIIEKYKSYHVLFDTMVSPRINEAFKEVSATRTAEVIVKEREKVKQEALASVRKKVDGLVSVDDLIIENLQLSKELQAAIEQKMVQEQEAAKAKFFQLKEKTDAETKVIKARGEAEAIEIINKTLRNDPSYLQLEMIKKWNGVAPLVVGDAKGNFMLPIK